MSFERSEQKRMNQAVEAWTCRWSNMNCVLDPSAIPNPTDTTTYTDRNIYTPKQ